MPAKTKNGARPSHCVGSLSPRTSPGGAAAGWEGLRSLMRRLPSSKRTGRPHGRPDRSRKLLDVGADHRIPILGDGFLGFALLFERREDRRRVGLSWRHIGQHLGRDLAVLGEVIEA